jgi:hypothetical protein
MAHDQEPNSTSSGNARVAATFRRVSQAVRLAILLFPAALSAEDVDGRPRATRAGGDSIRLKNLRRDLSRTNRSITWKEN